MRRLFLTLAAAAALAGLTLPALAGERPYDKAGFDNALAAGQPVIVDFAADWCPTCKAQKPIVQGLLAQKKLEPVTLFVADFDKETALKKQLGVTMQSTVVVFNAGKEVGRSTGQTQKEALSALFDKAI